jgi:hypothetical protein
VAAALVAALAVTSGCGGGGDRPSAGRAEPAERAATTTTVTAPAGAETGLAGAIRPLPPAEALPSPAPAGPAPVSLDVAALDVAGAPIVDVGLAPDGDMEIPAVDEAGWYRFGPAPGRPGTAVLAAHVAYDGVDGVFRHLADLGPGDEVVVGLDGGGMERFVVDDVARYPKTELPGEVWARDGEPRLVLITCGGDFDPSAGHYEDNVVAWASPA